MIVCLVVKNYNLHTGNVTLKEEHIKGFWNGTFDRLWVCTEDGQRLESYHGELLRKLVMSARPFYDDNGNVIYYLATRWLMEMNK